MTVKKIAIVLTHCEKVFIVKRFYLNKIFSLALSTRTHAAYCTTAPLTTSRSNDASVPLRAIVMRDGNAA